MCACPVAPDSEPHSGAAYSRKKVNMWMENQNQSLYVNKQTVYWP